MRVEKLDLCKNTLKFLLRELHHDDRFCLISFSDEAKVEVPMLKVNEDQKRVAIHTIDHLSVRGRTNIASAISLAAQIANGVPHPNKVRSVFRKCHPQRMFVPTI
jgi:Mg-chelatase subunit ChlD